MLRIALPDVTYEYLDGEVIAIHFTRGTYFSMRGAAAVAFMALCEGFPIQNLTDLYSSAPGNAAEQLRALAETWVTEGLLETTDSPEGRVIADTKDTVLWVEPSSEKFSDMEQLLLADPIHDVGPNAWPVLVNRSDSHHASGKEVAQSSSVAIGDR